MAAAWDRLDDKQRESLRDAAVRTQVRDVLLPGGGLWATHLRAAGVDPATLTSVAALRRVPALAERDLCPDGDPGGAAALVRGGAERAFIQHAGTDVVTRALLARGRGRPRFRRAVQDEMRALVFSTGGTVLPLPLAATRNDLDVVARAGARLWSVLGLTAADVLVAALPGDGRVDVTALPLAAVGAGAPAATAAPPAAARLLATLPATVVAVRDSAALAALGELPGTVTTVLVTGDQPLDPDAAAALGDRRVRRVFAPADHRLLWAECSGGGGRPGGALHSYPDLDVVSLADPATGEDATGGGGPTELVLTQLGLRGSALLRWRTGAVLPAGADLGDGSCPACGRTGTRIPVSVVGRAVRAEYQVRGRTVQADLRAVAGALAGTEGVAGFQAGVEQSERDGAGLLLLRLAVAAGADPTTVAVSVSRAVSSVAGAPPSQVVVDPRVLGRQVLAVPTGG